jgi:hypothetical protein
LPLQFLFPQPTPLVYIHTEIALWRGHYSVPNKRSWGLFQIKWPHIWISSVTQNKLSITLIRSRLTACRSTQHQISRFSNSRVNFKVERVLT